MLTKISFNHYLTLIIYIKEHLFSVWSTKCYNLLDSNNIVKGKDEIYSMNYDNPHAIFKKYFVYFYPDTV